MGCIGSKTPHTGTKSEQQQSSKIDEFLRKERRDLEHEVKLLLLGKLFFSKTKKKTQN